MYNKRGGGEEFAKFNSVNLAWWHNYKHASLLICRRFGNTIFLVFAPLWHVLYPSSIFPVKPSRLTALTTVLMFLFYAYPSFKSSLALLSKEDLAPRFEALRSDLVF